MSNSFILYPLPQVLYNDYQVLENVLQQIFVLVGHGTILLKVLGRLVIHSDYGIR